MNRNANDQFFRMKNSKDIPKEFIYFVHIPRTGGKYVKKKFKLDLRVQWFGKMEKFVLGSKRDEHPCVYSTPVINQSIGKNQTESYLLDPLFLDPRSLVVTTVRNPFDRYVSAFLEAKGTYEKYKNYSFEKFIDDVCDPDYKEDPNYGFSFELTQKFFPYQVFNDLGYCVAHLILRKEKLNDGLNMLKNMFKLDFESEGSSDYPPGEWAQNRKDRFGKVYRDYRTYYNNRTVDIVSKLRENELRAFCYDFENNYSGFDWFATSNFLYKKEENKFWFTTESIVGENES